MSRAPWLVLLLLGACGTTAKDPPPPLGSASVVPAAPGAVGPRAAGKDPRPVDLGVPNEEQPEPPDGAAPHLARPSSSGVNL